MPERAPVVKFADTKRVLRDLDRALARTLKEERERAEFAAERRRQEARGRRQPALIITVGPKEEP